MIKKTNLSTKWKAKIRSSKKQKAEMQKTKNLRSTIYNFENSKPKVPNNKFLWIWRIFRGGCLSCYGLALGFRDCGTSAFWYFNFLVFKILAFSVSDWDFWPVIELRHPPMYFLSPANIEPRQKHRWIPQWLLEPTNRLDKIANNSSSFYAQVWKLQK